MWLLSLLIITIVTTSAFTELYPSQEEVIAIVEAMKNPEMTAMVGPGYGLDNYTTGAMMAHQMLLFTAVAVAVMSILFVTAHTRYDEEEGRTEMIRSLPVGRLSNLSAVFIVFSLVFILLTLLTGLGMSLLNIDSINLKGSLIYGAALGSVGILFAAITGLFAQLSDSSRGTMGYSFATLGIFYLVRAVGDVGAEWLSLISPLGLILRTEAYVNNYWWPILLTIILSSIIIAAALILNSRRDIEAGFIAAKPGKSEASIFLKTPLGLAVNLQRVTIIGWAVGMFVLGLSYGSVFGDLESFFETNEMYQQILPSIEGFSLSEQFLTMLMAVMSMIGTIPVLLMIFKLRAEEKHNRLENILARAVSRKFILGNFLILSIIVSVVMLFTAASGLWAATSVAMEDPFAFSLILKSIMVYLPAIWVMVAVGVFFFGKDR